jgi:aminoglycoside phosphotransferase (APT) family kinase protein
MNDNALTTIVAKVTGLSTTKIKVSPHPVLEHQSNQLYDAWAGDRHLIVKEFLKPDEQQDAPWREFEALNLLAPLDIAPQPIAHILPHSAARSPLVLYEYMEGEAWDRHRPTAAELTQLAEVWLKINSVAPDDLWESRGQDRPLDEIEARFHADLKDYADWVESEFHAGRRAVDLCFMVLESRHSAIGELSDLTPALRFCRADPRFANVIRRPDGRLGLVDWEDSGLSDPARDLADLMTHPNQEDLVSPKAWKAFLKPYLAVQGKSDRQIKRRVDLYLALFPIYWLISMIRRGIQLAREGHLRGWVEHGLPAGEKLRRYLARGLAWPELKFARQMQTLSRVAFFPSV